MSRPRLASLLAAALLAALAAPASAGVARSPLSPEEARPDAIVDLATREGASLVSGSWRYSDARLVEIESPGVGPDLKPSGVPGRTLDVSPAADVAGFDDSSWTRIEPESLTGRRGPKHPWSDGRRPGLQGVNAPAPAEASSSLTGPERFKVYSF